VTGVATGLAGVVSQLVGGLLIDHGFGHLGWRLIFLVNLPVGLTALCGGRYLLVETRAAKAANLDLIGAAIAALTVGLVLLPIMLGREFSWPWWSVTAPLLAVPMLICFVRYEKTISRQGGAPLVDISLFRNRRFVFGVLAVSLFYSAIASFFLALTMYLQPGLGFSPLTSGMIFAPTAACFLVGSLLAPRLSSRIGNAVLVIGVASFAIGIALSIFVSSNPEPNLTLLVISLMLNGLGQGLVIPVAADVILSGVPVHQAGISSGILVTLQVIGNIVGVVVVGIIFYSMLDLYSVSIGIARASVYGHAFASATSYNLGAALISGGCFASLLHTANKPQVSLQT
jgi:MFS family permease